MICCNNFYSNVMNRLMKFNLFLTSLWGWGILEISQITSKPSIQKHICALLCDLLHEDKYTDMHMLLIFESNHGIDDSSQGY